jgi:hypothetical protein
LREEIPKNRLRIHIKKPLREEIPRVRLRTLKEEPLREEIPSDVPHIFELD